jgi:PAS domain S-box-containing protein
MTLAWWMRWLVISAGVVALYGLLGLLALQLAKAPGYSAPIYPGAGLALAAILTWGWSMLPAVAIGQVLVKLANPMPGLWDAMWVPLIIGAASAAQAGAGAWLVRRWIGWPNHLQAPAKIALFGVLAGPLACVVGASICISTLAWQGLLAPDAIRFTWVLWWLGDAVGVLACAPIFFSFLAKPPAVWRSRRILYNLPILVAIGVIAVTSHLRDKIDQERIENSFDTRVASVAGGAREQIRDIQVAINTLAALVESDNPDYRVFERTADEWLSQMPSLSAIAALRLGPDREALGLVSRQRAPIDPDWQGIVREPLVSHALERSKSTQRSSSTLGSAIEPGSSTKPAVYIVRVVNSRATSPLAAVVIQLDAEKLMLQAASRNLGDLLYCVLEPSSGTVLAGHSGCTESKRVATALPMNLFREARVELPDQAWLIQLTPSALFGASMVRDGPLLAATGATFALMLLAILLLIVTGQTELVKGLVAQRTTALREQLAQRAKDAKALRASQGKWRSMVQTMPVGMVYLKPDGQVQRSNPKAALLLGYSLAELEKLSLVDLFDVEERRLMVASLAQALKNNESGWQSEHRVIRKDGSRLDIEVHVIVMRDEANRPTLALAVFYEIASRRQLQQATQAREVAEQANRAKSQFLASMGHELRTPLNALLGFTQLLRLDPSRSLDAKQAEQLAYVEQSGWHLLSMIGDIMDFSLIEAGNLRVNVEPIDVVETVAQCVQMLEPDATRSNIGIQLPAVNTSVFAMADPIRLRQVMLNLLSNAIKYNRPQGTVVVSLALDQAIIRIEVRDSGIGMSSEQLAHLFEPFNRLGRQNSAIHGTGIGLVVSRHLAHAMSGTLTITSQAGQGTLAMLRLKRASAHQLVDLDDREQHRQNNQQDNPAHNQNQQRLEKTR